MKRKFLVSLLCLAVLLVPGFTNAASSYITADNFTASQLATLKANTGEVNVLVGNVRMLKFNTEPNSEGKIFTVLTFSEKGGFTTNTYNSILSVMKLILSTKYYNSFVQNYPSIDTQTPVEVPGFRVRRNPTPRVGLETRIFAEDESILRVEICFDDLGPEPTPVPTPTPTPKPTVENPSTGDMNMIVVGSIVTVAVLGAYFSVRKIREN